MWEQKGFASRCSRAVLSADVIVQQRFSVREGSLLPSAVQGALTMLLGEQERCALGIHLR